MRGLGRTQRRPSGDKLPSFLLRLREFVLVIMVTGSFGFLTIVRDHVSELAQ